MRNDSRKAVNLARTFRRNPTEAEIKAWELFGSIKEARFRRQYPVGNYVLDFYSPRYRLCVEVDGPMHDKVRDAIRDRTLLDEDIFTLRFTTDEVYANADKVGEEILKTLAWRKKLWGGKKKLF